MPTDGKQQLEALLVPAGKADQAEPALGGEREPVVNGRERGFDVDEAPVLASGYAVSDERLRIGADGSIFLRLKTPWKDGSTHVVYEPLDFIAKLAAQVPRSHKNLVVYHGVLAANAAWRSRVVAYGRQGGAGCGCGAADAS